METEKKYLKWYNKMGYGFGQAGYYDLAMVMNSFLLIYVTNAIGLNSGIVGVLIMVSKIFDGISDVIVGHIIDRTHTKMGKARPWLLIGSIGDAISFVLMFSIPMGVDQRMQYVYFFIWYLVFNAVTYTITSIALSTLTALITKNKRERVEIGAIGTMLGLLVTTIITYVTLDLVEALGGGATGWRNAAMLNSAFSLAVSLLAFLLMKELPEEELDDLSVAKKPEDDKIGFWASVKLLLTNKYWVLMMLSIVCSGVQVQTNSGVGVFYATYVLGDSHIYGSISLAGYIPMVIGVILTPILIRKFGTIYKTNCISCVAGLCMRVFLIMAGLMLNVPFLLVMIAITGLVGAPVSTTGSAWLAAVSENIYLSKGKRIDGMVFAGTSMGAKIGNGIGAALTGWLLAAGGFENGAAVQPQSAVNMMQFMFLGIPTLIGIVGAIVCFKMKVEKDNDQLTEKIRIVNTNPDNN